MRAALRRIAVGATIALVILSASAVASYRWVGHKLGSGALDGTIVCIDRQLVRFHPRTAIERDVFVLKILEFDGWTGKAPSLMWHARGLLLWTTYRLLWSRADRDRYFERAVSHARTCPS